MYVMITHLTRQTCAYSLGKLRISVTLLPLKRFLAASFLTDNSNTSPEPTDDQEHQIFGNQSHIQRSA